MGLPQSSTRTLHPDSSQDFDSAHLNWWIQRAVQGSAAEHGTLRSFYQTNAISTVKLLQQAGANMVVLNARQLPCSRAR